MGSIASLRSVITKQIDNAFCATYKFFHYKKLALIYLIIFLFNLIFNDIVNLQLHNLTSFSFEKSLPELDFCLLLGRLQRQGLER